MGGQAHALLPAGGDDRRVAERDVLRAQGDGAQAGAADLVDAPGRRADRKAGLHMGLAGGVLALSGGEDLAQDRLGDLVLVHARALDQRLEHRGAEIVGRHAGERAAEAAHGGCARLRR